MTEERSVYMVPIEKPEGKRPLGRSKHRWDNNIKLHRREMDGGYGLDSFGLG
jgi:hypothetical protein